MTSDEVRILPQKTKNLEKCVNPLEFNFPESHNHLENPPSHQTVDLDSQKKEKMPYPRCGLGACLRCGRAS